ncbi:MAG TPA: hypothetical protein VNX21_06565 [Candidatus Thermoplasmatota archaeon]|nr:hypothetical protein [Candidatus Thermoplasmatota archaeon]
MRTLLVLAVLGALLAPSAAASSRVTLVAASEDARLLHWEAVPGADGYTVYRGASPDRVVALGQTDVPLYLDDAPAPGLDVYVVVAWSSGSDSGSISTSSGPACVTFYDGLRFRLNVRGCLVT